MEMRLYIFLFLVLALAACDRAERVEAPTAAETEQLNEAEAMLDNISANDAGPSANEEGPATEAADPINRSN